MSPKSLFIIIVRIIGLFLLIGILQVVPQLLKTFNMLLLNDLMTAIIGAVFSLSVLFIYYLIVRACLFKSEKLVQRLSLDKNFEEEVFEFNIHHSTIVKLAVIFIGGYTFIQFFIPLLLNIYALIQNKTQPDSDFYINSSFDFFNLVHHTCMVLIGYFMVTNSKGITNYIELKRRK